MGKTSNEEFSKELEKYVKSLVLELKATNKSKNTISSYSNTFYSFIAFIKQKDEEISLDTIKKSNIIEFLEYKNELLEKHEEMKASTKNLLIVHLKKLFKHIEHESSKLYDFDKVFDIKIKTPTRLAKGLESKDKSRLLNYLTELLEQDCVTNYRNSLIIKLMLFAGLRRGEVENIKLSDFIEEDEVYVLNVIGKGDKEREVYIKTHLIEMEINELTDNDYTYICETKNKKLMDGSQIYRMIQSIFKKLKIKASVHDLRHTYAKTLAKKGFDITIIQQLLGHESTQTTSIYLTPTKKSKREACLSV